MRICVFYLSLKHGEKWKMMTTYGRKLHAFKWITTMIYIVWIDCLSTEMEDWD